ncbi:tRNA (adenosine(37)-N6)-dimethylallyltransferase MiaA [Luteibaculum oceani]|uniref:tRNA dimethylallyltransferase n=1 Tax=Luteibaculum oceani TaxID=1294296 RepID=A0A5C6VB79_9FLAO|nr:tRNA (adenosine(37)-N6)-dimethylallyltransferase MiaA [Luteibaculum oceani]TXC81656.1 tRNA (adenosine(37)-N6)-dimethylallyltransferase MiaA [Luteibaculum oceani]
MDVSCPNILFVMGPTAIGKSAVAAKLAQFFNTHVISADSRQFYRELPIGTAHPSATELELAPHHFIGNLELTETWSASKFANESLALLKNPTFNPLAIFCGGSGFYLRALEYELDDIPEAPEEVRAKLNLEIKEHGLSPLQGELREKDPGYYSKVDIHNPQRVIRALEVIRFTGKRYSDFLSGTPKKRPFNCIKVGLEMDRAALYDRINKRVDLMMAAGLEEEAKRVYPQKHLNSLNTVGYKELFQYFDGNCSKEEAIDEIKKNTRRFAKRQMTWLRREEQVEFFHPSDFYKICEYVQSKIKLP